MAYSSARALDANEFPPYGRDADGDGDHDHLYPVLENRLKRNRMAGDPPDILLQPYCPKFRRSIFIAPERRSPRGNWR